MSRGPAADSGSRGSRKARGRLAALLPLERLDQPLASRPLFLARLAVNVGIVGGLVAVSLLFGMVGYHFLERQSWLDAFLNAAMILSGMGPASELQSSAGKLFAGFYALYSGLFLIVAAGIVLSPFFHRVMHRLHLPDEADEGEDAGTADKAME